MKKKEFWLKFCRYHFSSFAMLSLELAHNATSMPTICVRLQDNYLHFTLVSD